LTNEERQQAIHDKGFAAYDKIKVGTKTLKDAILKLGMYQDLYNEHGIRFYDKREILRAIAENDKKKMRAISDFFYRTNGIYQRICNYYATMYRYDWYTIPTIFDEEILEDEKKGQKVINEFFKVLDCLDNTHVKKLCAEVTMKVIKYGVCYGAIVETSDSILFQELPIDYCRCRYYVNNMPAIEFNMAYFDEHFKDVNYRMRVLKMFPKDFQKGYVLYKNRKLQPDYVGDGNGWYLLDPGTAVKFSLTASADIPLFINVIPLLLDLDAAQDLDRRKQMQDLLKVIVQEAPLDKNGDLIFDMDELLDHHYTAIEMLSHAVGVDVLTTPLKVSSVDLSDSSNVDDDDLERVERTVYNAAGVPKNLFNSDRNIALSSSILQDEGVMRDLKLQLEILFDTIIQKRVSNKKKYNFRFYFLDTTQYNYKELAKTYKDQMTVGFGKMFAQIALGHSQNAILSTAYFENDILGLSEVMVPPMMSSSIGSDDIQTLGNSRKAKKNGTQSNSEGGRPPKEESELSTKTIQNKESM